MGKFRIAVYVVMSALIMFTAVGCNGCEEDGETKDGPQVIGPPPGAGPEIPDVPTDGKTVGQLLDEGTKALEDGNFDNALGYFEAAYKKDPNDPEAIANSAVAMLAAVSIDKKVVEFLRERVGFTSYPGTFSSLLDFDKWMTAYTQEEYRDGYYTYSYNLVSTTPRYDSWGDIEYYYYDSNLGRYLLWIDAETASYGWYPGITQQGYYFESETYVPGEYYQTTQRLPNLVAPNWVKGGNNSVYSMSLNKGAPTIETWGIIMLANLLEKNSNGLNDFLDDLIAAVFGSGSAFDIAHKRIDQLKGTNYKITFPKEYIDELELDDVFDETDGIGWAELNALMSVMTGVKGVFEWVASYDWNTNLNFLKYAWASEMDFYNRFKTVDAKDLPFRNNFLKARPGKMAASKASFTKAIQGLQASYTAILSDPKYPQAVKDAHATINQGTGLLVQAINNNGKFYFPDDPTRGSWPTSGQNGIDIGKLFTEGYFAIDKMFEVEADGKTPVFYVAMWYDYYDEKRGYWTDTLLSVKLTKENYLDMLSIYGYAGFKLKSKHVTSVAISPYNDDTYDPILDIFPGNYAKLLFEKYHNLQLTPWDENLRGGDDYDESGPGGVDGPMYKSIVRRKAMAETPLAGN